MKNLRFLISALLLLGFAINKTNAQVVIPQSGNQGFVQLCNNSSNIAIVERITAKQTYELSKLSPNSCYYGSWQKSDIMGNIFLLRGTEKLIVYEALREKNNIDWEKILYLFIGSLIGSIAVVFKSLTSIIKNVFVTNTMISQYKKRLIVDLNSAGVDIEFPSNLSILLSENNKSFITKKKLEEIKTVRDIYQQVLEGEISNIEAIKALGGKV